MVAYIFLQRLSLGMTLGSDATLQYALGYSKSENTWWRINITQNELELNSPYNTRLNPGLPPSPIDSPDITSIQAVLNPTPNPYLYFLSDKNGVMHYAQTLTQQNQNISEYL